MTNIPDYIIKTYKSLFNFHLRDPNARATIPMYHEPPHPKYCAYCGGLKSMMIFNVQEGPFGDQPVMTGKVLEDSKAIITSHWMELNGKKGWYIGITIAISCPNCHGTGLEPTWVESPVSDRQLDMTGVMKEMPTVNVPDDDDLGWNYTNV